MEKFWTDHAYLLYLATIGSYGVMIILVRVIVKNGVKSLTQLSDGIKDLYGKYDDLYDKHNELHHKFSRLQGEHEATKHLME